MVFERLRDVGKGHVGRERLLNGEQILLLAVRGRVFREIVAKDVGGVRDDHGADVQLGIADGKVIHGVERFAENGGIRRGRDLDEIVVIAEVDAVGFLLPEERIEAQLRGDPAVAGEKLIGKGRLKALHIASVQEGAERRLFIILQLAVFSFGKIRFGMQDVDQTEDEDHQREQRRERDAMQLAVAAEQKLLPLGVDRALFGCVHEVTSLRTVRTGRIDRSRSSYRERRAGIRRGAAPQKK